MPSVNFLLALFFSFICGQFFNALCASLSAPVNTVEVLTVASGNSVQSLVVVVVVVLVVHDILVVFLLRHLLQVPTPPIRKNVVKAFLLASGDIISDWLDVPRLLIAACRGPAAPRINQSNPHRLLLGPTIPRPLRIILSRRIWTISCPLVPRIEYLTVPVLVISSVSRAPTCHSRPRLGLPGRHAQAWQFVLGLLLALATATASRSAADVCHAFIEEVIEDDSERTGILVLRSKAVVKAKIDAVHCKPCGRSHPFYFPLLRHVSAAATLRKSPVCIVVEGARYAINEVSITPASGFGERVKVSRVGCFSYPKIGFQVPKGPWVSLFRALSAPRLGEEVEEIVDSDDSETTLVAEGGCKSTNVEKVDLPAFKHISLPAHSRPSYIPFLRHLSSAATLRKQLGRVVVDEPCHATIEEVVDNEITLLSDSGSLEEETIDAVFVEEECDWEELPSYEEFAQGAPTEPLFEEKYMSFAFIRGSCLCPPPLSALAARTGAKPPPQASRASRLPLLARLSIRVCKMSALAEPFSLSA
ncbi:hypothetical protein B0H11DRAFT_1972277 [Mycena galericulata]|nr:hypothetical protein B0H11DRAFT_1972277 [Mycena galericulata]